MKYIDLDIGSKEWLEFRKTKIGASQTGAILGICPFRSILDVYDEKVSDKTFFINDAMKRGLEREIEARLWAEKTLDIPLEPKMIENELYPWKFATLDCFSPLDKVIVEIKWANKAVHSKAKKGEVVDYYYVQCQSQMMCAGVKEMWFLSCYQEEGEDVDFIIVKVNYDESMVQRIIEEEKDFYYNHLLPKIRPESPKDKHDLVEDDFIFDMLCEEDLELSKKEKLLKQKREEIKANLKNLCHGKSKKSQRYKFTEIVTKGRIDYEAIEVLKEIDIEKYRVQGTAYYRIDAI